MCQNLAITRHFHDADSDNEEIISTEKQHEIDEDQNEREIEDDAVK